jgi:hypothetical protein
LRNHFK